MSRGSGKMSTVAVNRRKVGEVESGVRSRRRSRARAKVVGAVLNRTIVFLSLVLVAYLGTNITGHILIDQARKEASVAKARLTTASRAVAGLERRVQELKSSSAVETWALANNFEQAEIIPGIEVPEGGTLVAQRD